MVHEIVYLCIRPGHSNRLKMTPTTTVYTLSVKTTTKATTTKNNNYKTDTDIRVTGLLTTYGSTNGTTVSEWDKRRTYGLKIQCSNPGDGTASCPLGMILYLNLER